MFGLGAACFVWRGVFDFGGGGRFWFMGACFVLF